MARYGKIARLPRLTRDQLNQRLDNGESGVQLIEWLNTLPEVKQVLDAHFDAQPITDGNLSEWKKRGFRQWQKFQQALSFVQEFSPDGDGRATARLAEPLQAAVLAHYADALSETEDMPREEPRDRVSRLGNSIRDIARICRCEHDRDRVEIQRQRLALGREWLDLEKSRIENRKNGSSPRSLVAPKSDEGGPDLDSMSREERSAYIKKIIYGD